MEVTELNEDEKCQSCQNEEALELHTCPYREDVSNDFETLCNCCNNCISECCQDI